MEQQQDQDRGWVIKSDLREDELIRFITENGITRDRVVAITEPERGKFTLIFEGTAEQHGAYISELAKYNQAIRSGPWMESTPIRRG